MIQTIIIIFFSTLTTKRDANAHISKAAVETSPLELLEISEISLQIICQHGNPPPPPPRPVISLFHATTKAAEMMFSCSYSLPAFTKTSEDDFF